MEKVYLDQFATRYVTERSPYAPPERYITIKGSAGDMYTEIWNLEGGRRKTISIMYTMEVFKRGLVEEIRQDAVDKYGGQLVNMMKCTVPQSVFLEILKIIKEKDGYPWA